MIKQIGILIACALVIIVLFNFFKSTMLYEKQSQDGRKWTVVNFENSSEAAELLARLDKRMREFVEWLRRKYKVDVGEYVDNGGVSVNDVVSRFVKKYTPDMIEETDLRWTDDTSWTVAKGEKMYLCLRDKKQHLSLVDLNTLVYVCLHEMAHVANPEWGHGRQFWQMFAFILSEAVAAGIYMPVDYEKYPVQYCGLMINYQPLFDSSLGKFER